ncbi:MAG: flagellar basal body rod C-terminal domain-containing protein [Buchnera aphidicola (Kaburagia rhusicola rhusicola)]
MESSIYLSMMSAKKILENQEILANNLANMLTTGFKAELYSRTILNDHVSWKKNPYGFEKRYDLTQGSFRNTMQPLDIAVINPDGWIVVKVNKNNMAYTKNGHLKVNEKRQLTSQGYIIMGKDGPIVIPQDVNCRILSNGTITITKGNNKFNQKLNKIKLVKIKIENLIHRNSGLYFINDKNQSNKIIKDNPHIKILSETLEDSNVNPSESMVNIISDSRKFDMQMKILTSFDENIQLVNKFLNINN